MRRFEVWLAGETEEDRPELKDVVVCASGIPGLLRAMAVVAKNWPDREVMGTNEKGSIVASLRLAREEVPCPDSH